MNKQRCLLNLASFFLGCMLAMNSLAEGKTAEEKPDSFTYTEGVEYIKITPAQLTQVAPGKVEVLELFWYGCPHCYKLEPYINKWLKNRPAAAEFIRTPAALNPKWKVHAGAYYVAELLNITDKIHEPLFDAIQKNRRGLNTPDSLAEFFSKYGVEKKKFLEIYNSFAVRTRLSRDYGQVKRYGIRSVPSIIINGKYRTNATLAGGKNEDLIKLINFLVEKESLAEKKISSGS